MMIRLAHYQGLLAQPSLNMFQYFAAEYWVRMDRRISMRDVEDTLQRQTWYIAPDRYQELFLMGALDIPETADAEDRAEPKEDVVTDIDEIDRYFDSLDEKRVLTGAQLFDVLDDDEGWV
jgi:hypothetical protein